MENDYYNESKHSIIELPAQLSHSSISLEKNNSINKNFNSESNFENNDYSNNYQNHNENFNNDEKNINCLYANIDTNIDEIKEVSNYSPLSKKFELGEKKECFIYMIGGRSRGKTLSKIERYSITQNKWEKCINLSEARGSTSACSVEPFIYVMGGGGIKSNLSTCEKLNSKTNIWEKIDDISIARHALSCVAVKNKIYLIGGWIAGTISSKNVEIFDTNTEKWTQLASLLVPRRLHGVCYLEKDNRIYVFGGQTNLGVIDDVESYCINEDKWEIRKRLPQAGCTQVVNIGDSIYVFIMPKCIFKYDYEKDEYQKIKNGDFPLEEWYGFSAVALGNKIYVLGGTSKGRYCDDVFSFDVCEFNWEKLANMYTARRRSSAVLISV